MTNKYGPNKRTEQNSKKKRTKRSGDNQTTRHGLQNTGYLDAQGTNWVQEQNKTQEETRVALSEIKENLQGTNIGRDEATIQINNLEHKEEICSQPEQQEGKRILKMRIV